MSTESFTRAVTIFAVGFLLLNATLLFIVQRFILGGVFAVAAVLVVLGWFWYRRAMRELAEDWQDLKREAESIRDLLHTHHQS